MMHWKRVWWWQDILGGFDLVNDGNGQIVGRVYRSCSGWVGPEGTRYADKRSAMLAFEKEFRKKLETDLAENLEAWYRLQNELNK